MPVLIVWLCAILMLISAARAETTVSLAGDWQISAIEKSSKPVDVAQEEARGFWKTQADTTGWQKITIPTMNGFYSVAKDDVFPAEATKNYWFANFRAPTFNWAWYRHGFETPAIPDGSRLYIKFLAVAWESHLWINGKKIGMHRGAFTGFEYDITDAVNRSGRNVISLLAITDFGQRPIQRVYGKMFYPRANMGGIVGPVELRVRPAVHVKRMQIVTDLNQSTVNADVWVHNTTGAEQTIELSARIVAKGDAQRVGTLPKPMSVKAAKGLTKTTISVPAKDWKAWSPDQPALYELVVSIAQNGRPAEEFRDRFGFRTFETRDGKFFLNGERIRLYYGNILTLGNFRFYDEAGATKFREWLRRQKAQGVNTIRYHMAGADSFMMLGICDEEGMLVIDEWAWFHRVETAIKDAKAREVFFQNNDYEMRAWIERDFNHPSNIFWSLSNEVWTPGEVVLLDHTYQQMRKLDPTSRPMSNSSGFHSVIRSQAAHTDVYDFHNYSMHSEYPWSLMHESIQTDFDALTKIYGKVEKPVVVSESLNITKNQIKNRNPITPELYVELAGSYGVREVGMIAMKDPQRNAHYMVDTFGVRTLEKFRQDTRIQGFSPWFEANRSRLPDGIASVYGPYYVGYRDLTPHVAAKKTWKTNVTIIKDPLGEQKTQLRAEVLGSTGTKLFSSQQDVTLPRNQDETTAELAVGELPAGKVRIRLELWQGQKRLAWREDAITVMDAPAALSAAAPGNVVAIYQPAATRQSVLKIMQAQGISVRAIESLNQLDGVNTLIIGNGWDDSLAAHGPALRKWIEQGGRLVAFEAAKTAALPWATGYETVRNGKIRQPFVDLVVPGHPVFAGLEPELFDGWNGENYLIVDTAIAPLTANVLAAIGTYGHGPMAAVMEASQGKGTLLMTQLKAVERYDSDPVAARFVHNVLQYALTPPTHKVRELVTPSRGKLLEMVQGVPENKVVCLDLRKVANAPLKETFGGSSQLDFRHLPAGRQKFRSIPFDIVEAAGNGGKSIVVMQGNRTPDMPKRVTDIAVNQFAQTLYFLHTAYYATPNTMARYIVEYEDQSRVEIVVDGKVIGDWFQPTDRPAALVAWAENHPVVSSARIGLYVLPWSNPHPEKKIKSLEVLAEGSEQHSGGSVTLVAVSVRLAK